MKIWRTAPRSLLSCNCISKGTSTARPFFCSKRVEIAAALLEMSPHTRAKKELPDFSGSSFQPVEKPRRVPPRTAE